MVNKIKIDNFDALFDQYKGWVYKTAYLMMGNHHKAEDVMQEVFINAYKSIDTFDPQKGSISTWLRKITINQCLKSNRNEPPQTYSIEDMEDHGQSISDGSSSIPEQISLRNDIKQLLSSLDNKHRAVLILRYYEGLAYSEIAKLLNIPLGTVKSRISIAISTLQKEQEQAREDKSDELR